MNNYIVEVCFGDTSDLPGAAQVYNAKANKFQTGLREVEQKYQSWLCAHHLRLGVETVDNFDNCTIKLKLLPERLSEDIQSEVVTLFNTIWSK